MSYNAFRLWKILISHCSQKLHWKLSSPRLTHRQSRCALSLAGRRLSLWKCIKMKNRKLFKQFQTISNMHLSEKKMKMQSKYQSIPAKKYMSEKTKNKENTKMRKYNAITKGNCNILCRIYSPTAFFIFFHNSSLPTVSKHQHRNHSWVSGASKVKRVLKMVIWPDLAWFDSKCIRTFNAVGRELEPLISLIFTHWLIKQRFTALQTL